MADASRAATPPRTARPGSIPRSPMTPEKIRRMEEARLKAKALRSQQRASNQEAYPSRTPSGFVAGQKRPHVVVPGSSVQPNQRDARQTPSGDKDGFSKPARDSGIEPAKKFQKFVEYDFSKMTDTKGGFLTAEDDPHNRALHTPNQEQKPANMTLKEWEKAQLIKKLKNERAGPYEPGLSALGAAKEQKKCRECDTLEIDWKWDDVFGCQVCKACQDKFPDKYSLLTKTEAREDYLLTDPELKDEQLLPRLEKPNPHKSTWNNMMLYLRYQVEEYAFSDKKWGSPEALDEEFEKRQGEAKRRKEVKFKSKLNDLKRRTRVDAYKRQKAGVEGGNFGDKLWGSKHEHEWGRAVENPETGATVKTCVECGMEVEELEF
ncbi:DNA repair protein [Aureobasidium pullulans]|nr:DNA repair protein [Aureobasidium pullulans]